MGRKIILVVGLVAAIVLSFTVGVQAIQNIDKNAIENENSSIGRDAVTIEKKEIPGESIIIKRQYGYTLIKSHPHILSKADLMVYRNRNLQRLAMISEYEETAAVVTFNRPLTEKEVEEVLGKVAIGAVKFNSYPEGVGEIPFPLDDKERRMLLAYEREIGNKMKKLNNISEFRLIDGYVAARVFGNKRELQRIAADPRVFDVNIGPVEFRNIYPNSKILCGDDIFYELEKFRGY